MRYSTTPPLFRTRIDERRQWFVAGAFIGGTLVFLFMTVLLS